MRCLCHRVRGLLRKHSVPPSVLKFGLCWRAWECVKQWLSVLLTIISQYGNFCCKDCDMYVTRYSLHSICFADVNLFCLFDFWRDNCIWKINILRSTLSQRQETSERAARRGQVYRRTVLVKQVCQRSRTAHDDRRGWRTGAAQLNVTRRDTARVRIACRR